jgi:hypothetical protein
MSALCPIAAVAQILPKRKPRYALRRDAAGLSSGLYATQLCLVPFTTRETSRESCLKISAR